MSDQRKKGEIVEKIVRERGHKLTVLAKQLGMSRATLYKRFNGDTLTDDFLIKLQNIIHYDFSKEFPALKQSVLYEQVEDREQKYERKDARDLEELSKKYASILEESNKLLRFLVRFANENEMYAIREEIQDFIKNNLANT